MLPFQEEKTVDEGLAGDATSSRQQPGRLVYRFPRLDADGSARLRAALLGALDRDGVHTLEIDMIDVEFLGATAVSVLVELSFRARQSGCQLLVVNCTGQPMNFLELCDAATLIEIETSQGEAETSQTSPALRRHITVRETASRGPALT
ncbi:STAS domain-containing protein [Actinoplanes sp. CA-030573]|uniref:STAS domain-containing protein n=1 Tax=Actinoplanes sp. CA-030573 TaxID=3239898 RepID=UPI003D8DE5D8